MCTRFTEGFKVLALQQQMCKGHFLAVREEQRRVKQPCWPHNGMTMIAEASRIICECSEAFLCWRRPHTTTRWELQPFLVQHRPLSWL